MSFAAAIAAAGRAAAKAGGTKVTIVRGDAETDCVPATRGSTAFETLSTDGEQNIVITVRSQDFLVARDDYDFGDGPVEPERGDQAVLVEDDGSTHTYELLNLPGQPAWRWSDPYKQRLRLHMKEVPSS